MFYNIFVEQLAHAAVDCPFKHFNHGNSTQSYLIVHVVTDSSGSLSKSALNSNNHPEGEPAKRYRSQLPHTPYCPSSHSPLQTPAFLLPPRAIIKFSYTYLKGICRLGDPSRKLKVDFKETPLSQLPHCGLIPLNSLKCRC